MFLRHLIMSISLLYFEKYIYSAEAQQNTILKAVNTNHLPSLKPSYLSSVSCTHLSTVNMDDCSIRVELNTNIQICDISRKNDINLILFKQAMSERKIDKICKNIWCKMGWMGHCILVQVIDDHNNSSSKLNKFPVQAMRKWNIPCINISFKDEQSINDMMIFGIKYYWFRNVTH